MEGVLPITEYLIDIRSDIDDKSSGNTPTDDQSFLLYFIMGTYFGPNLKGEPQKSVFQRRAEDLPPYSLENLAGSCMKTVEVERIYYYVLRKADPSVILKLPFLQQFLHGNLSTSTKTQTLPFPQFDDLFPPDLHPHSMFKGQYEAINNIVFISDPKIEYIGSEYLERFKRLTKLEDICLDKDDARCHTSVDGKVLYNIDLHGDSNNNTSVSDCVTNNGTLVVCGSGDCVPTGMKTGDLAELGSDMIFIPSKPSREELINILNATKNGCLLTGTATMGQIGHNIGSIDIGECEDSYLFRVSLPGVKRDEREFSCEVEDDGKVSVRGVNVTGEKTVCRFDQIFEMQSQNLCPPGHFSVSFKLPGPVDPQQFSGNFGTDGILEGIVMKAPKKMKR
ncbi:putative alpha crystallin/Hsp20 domain, HSP20-like chaperone, increased DNA methylation [Helianthus annuus]|nr:putative alpha crystallin/Hsp20 domain, HSP20-like chaperone, increased DNA methylation [Helianthus annuus]